jgi:hypothetical protein
MKVARALHLYLTPATELDLGCEQAGDLAAAKAREEQWRNQTLAALKTDEGKAVCVNALARRRGLRALAKHVEEALNSWPMAIHVHSDCMSSRRRS